MGSVGSEGGIEMGGKAAGGTHGVGGSVGKYPSLRGSVGGRSFGDRIIAWVGDGRESSAGQRLCPQLLLRGG